MQSRSCTLKLKRGSTNNHIKRRFIVCPVRFGMVSSCAICVEPFNKVSRKPIICNFCELEACSSCVKTFLLGSNQDAHCMGCSRGWSREYVDGVLTKSFIDGEYKKHRQDVLFDRERAFLHETIPYAENAKKAREIGEAIRVLYRENNTLSLTLNDLNTLDANASIEERLKDKRAECEVKLKTQANMVEIEYLMHHQYLLEDKRRVDTRKQFIRACPANECRGFLSSQWKCGLCNVWACPECHEVIGVNKEADHTCDPNNVETAKALAKDTKACPKCASMIHKIDGCSQIWCTQCHTAFDWNTMRIETKRIHNPHYYEYMRQQNNGIVPREVGDVPCGDIPNPNSVYGKLINIFKEASRFDMRNVACRLDLVCRLHIHISQVEMQKCHVDIVQDNRDLRIRYLLKDIDDKRLKMELQKREKTSSKKAEMSMIFQMFLDASSDIVRTFVMKAKTVADAERSYNEMLELRAYTNAAFVKLGK